MRFKIFKKFLSLIPLIVISACSSNQETNNIDETSINSNIKNSNNSSFDEGDNLPIQALQSDNIVYFDLNKYNISSDFIKILDYHANFLRNNPSYKVTIEGHTDERGTPEYNISLGERRANAIRIYLQSKGVCIDQINIISYGKEKPAILGHNESAYAKNRRAILIY